MAKTKTAQPPRNPEAWINRLTTVLKAMDVMDSEERIATLKYLKSRYGKDWPSDNY
jgi:hypothetical protein